MKHETQGEIPTEPGYYLGTARDGVIPLIQVGVGGWVGYVGNQYRPAPNESDPLETFAPFTRMAPAE